MTTAKIKKETDAWLGSGSSTRACGSMYTGILVERLTNGIPKNVLMSEFDTMEEDEAAEAALTEQQQCAYEDLNRVVYEFLFTPIDPKYKTYFRTLPYEDLLMKSDGMYDGPVQGLTNVVCEQGELYFGGYRRYTDAAPDNCLHAQIERIQMGATTDDHDITCVYRQIVYRLNHISSADRYLNIMKLPKPKGQTCYEFDTYCMHLKIKDDYSTPIWDAIRDHEVLFPRFPRDGHCFTKGDHYLIAAFNEAKIPAEEAVRRIRYLAEKLESESDELMDLLVRLPDVVAKVKTLFEAFGASLDDARHFRRIQV